MVAESENDMAEMEEIFSLETADEVRKAPIALFAEIPSIFSRFFCLNRLFTKYITSQKFTQEPTTVEVLVSPIAPHLANRALKRLHSLLPTPDAQVRSQLISIIVPLSCRNFFCVA